MSNRTRHVMNCIYLINIIGAGIMKIIPAHTPQKKFIGSYTAAAMQRLAFLCGSRPPLYETQH